MNWTEKEFGTGVAVCDEQHRVIFAKMNALHEAVTRGDRAAVGRELDGLVDYVVMHFKTEEDLMKARQYPEYDAHKAAHDKLVATAADLQKKFHAGQAEVTEETTNFVRDWLFDHIPKVDTRYGPHIGP
ncbi:MAG TPA: bacteriohemerythrin [Nannocystis sp.]